MPLMVLHAVKSLWPYAKESRCVMICFKINSHSYELPLPSKGCYLPNPAPSHTLVEGSNRTVAFYDLMAEGEMMR